MIFEVGQKYIRRKNYKSKHYNNEYFVCVYAGKFQAFFEKFNHLGELVGEQALENKTKNYMPLTDDKMVMYKHLTTLIEGIDKELSQAQSYTVQLAKTIENLNADKEELINIRKVYDVQ